MKYIVIFGLVAVVILLILLNLPKPENKSNRYNQVITHIPVSKSKRGAGTNGEILLSYDLKRLKNNNSFVVSNCYLPRVNETTEIDNILVSPQGLFVFEMKNWNGVLYGNENESNWTFIREYNKEAENRYSPVMQNRTHIKCLKDFINIRVPVYSVIVFSDDCNISNIEISSSFVRIINFSELPALMREINSLPPRIKQEKVEMIFNKLEDMTNVSDAQRQRHISNIHREHPEQ